MYGELYEVAPESPGLGAEELRMLSRAWKAAESKARPGAAAGGEVGGHSKLMATFSSAASLDQVASAKPERLRGFEEDDRKQRTGGLGGRGTDV